MELIHGIDIVENGILEIGIMGNKLQAVVYPRLSLQCLNFRLSWVTISGSKCAKHHQVS